MAGLKDKRGFIDKERLDLSERKAVEYWMKRWGVTQLNWVGFDGEACAITLSPRLLFSGISGQ